MAVFLSEFSILKAGLTQKQYVATGLLAIFIVIAFFGIMLHINRMVFGAPENQNNGTTGEQSISSRNPMKNSICHSVAAWR